MATIRPLVLFFAFVAILLAGCASGPKRMRGLYLVGHEMNVFRPCGSSQTYWVQGSPSLMDELGIAHDALTERTAEEVLTVVRASFAPSGQPVAIAEVAGVIRVEEILDIRKAEASTCR